MCLGVPGKVINIEDNPLGLRMGKVSCGNKSSRCFDQPWTTPFS